MTAKKLEEEAKEAAIDIAAEVLGPLKLNGNRIEQVGIACALKSYLAAATLRDREIEELKAHLGRANSAATASIPWNAMLHLFRLVSNAQISARKAFELAQALVHGGVYETDLPYLLLGDPMTGNDPRDREIEELRAQTRDAGSFMSAKLAEIAELHAEQDRMLALLVSKEGENRELRARVKVLEGMVPRWVNRDDLRQLEALEWRSIGSRMIGDDVFQLMVPPVPVPGEKEG